VDTGYLLDKDSLSVVTLISNTGKCNISVYSPASWRTLCCSCRG